MAQLELETQADGATATVAVRGEVDRATAGQLRDLLQHLIDGGARRISLDCHGLDFLDSSGIGVLIAASTQLGAPGALTVEAPQAHVRRVLELTGVSSQLGLLP